MAEVNDTIYPKFHWADYLVFALSLLVSLLIGVYFAFTARRNKADSSTDFLLAGRNAQMVPVAMSMLASFLSAIFIIGVPMEVSINGTMFITCFTGYLLGAAVGAHVYVPVFHNMGITSVYEYLEKRFNKKVRILGSLTFIVMMLLYMAVVMYAPALAFSVVTGLSMWITIFGIGIICTLYTALGGMKAVIWTDTFQMVIILLGVIALVIKGTMDAGGISKVWQTSLEGGRIDFKNVSPDPRERHTWWTQSIGVAVNMLSLIAGNQIVIQRYLSIRKVRDAQISIYLALIGGTIMLLLLGLLGLVIYAYYGCDPLSKGWKAEQVVPLFMMQTLGYVHGLPGLFTASVFAASLSTVSSAVQALAAVFTEDIIRPVYMHFNLKAMPEKITAWIAKGLAMFFGLLTIGLSYLAPYMGPFLFQIALSILGTAGGPLFGLFTLAIFFPCANSWGAGFGLITSIILTYWINIGAIVIKVSPMPLPFRTEGCLDTTNTTMGYNYTDIVNATPTTTTSSPVDDVSEPGVYELYRISYLWYGSVSVIIVLVVGLLVSAITGFRRNQPPLESNLVFSYADRCCCCCSDDVRDTLRAGVTTTGEKDAPSHVWNSREALSDDVKTPEEKYIGIDHNGFTSTHL